MALQIGPSLGNGAHYRTQDALRHWLSALSGVVRYRSSITAITTILKQLPRPDCTKDDALWRRAGEAYSGSIGRWKRDVHDEGAVHDFLDERIANLAEAFLMMRPRRAATRLSK